METKTVTNIWPKIIVMLIIAIGVNVYWISPTLSAWILGIVILLYFIGWAKEVGQKRLDETTTKLFNEYVKEQAFIVKEGKIDLFFLKLLVHNCDQVTNLLRDKGNKEPAEIIEKGTAVLYSILNEGERALECTQKKSSKVSEKS